VEPVIALQTALVEPVIALQTAVVEPVIAPTAVEDNGLVPELHNSPLLT